MKKITAAALLSAGLLVSGCAGRTVVVVEATTTTTEYVAPLSKEDEYISSVVSEYPWVVNKFGKSFLVEFAETVCVEIDNGLTLEQLVQMSVQYQVDAEMLGFLTAAAIRNYCPHNQWFIDAALNA